MDVLKLASFSDGLIGGNPAGVVIASELPEAADMQAIAKSVGFSETAFCKKVEGGWRTRYFSPETEVPFCGHATIALGAALAAQEGDGEFKLLLNETEISVQGARYGNLYSATLISPPTTSRSLIEEELAETLSIFGYDFTELDPVISPAFAHAGANHFLVFLKDRKLLSRLTYDLDVGRKFMHKHGLITVCFGHAESEQLFHVRNAFASGGVLEDPATGAASAALSGYLRDISWNHAGNITFIQGEDMGSRSIIKSHIPPKRGEGIHIHGEVRKLN
ncbi:MAG: PhzF family phenazine biosynthesis protein [Salaquimonas sp.]